MGHRVRSQKPGVRIQEEKTKKIIFYSTGY
jgi:hypothetical protein